MKNRFLFPHRFKKIGWMLLIPAVIIGLPMALSDYYLFSLPLNVFVIHEGAALKEATVFSFEVQEVADELITVLAIVGGLLAAFSKERDEDEYIAKIRLESLLWATYINYGLLLFSIIFFYGSTFFTVLVFNMFTLLFIFLARFNFILYKTSKSFA